MHELGYVDGIIDAITSRAAGRPVCGATIRVGVRHRIVAEALDQAFAMAAGGTPLQGIALRLVQVPVSVICGACGAETSSTDPLSRCPACDDDDVTVSGGDELLLESIDITPSHPRGAEEVEH